MGSSDDGDDLLVTIGTPFDVLEENEPLPKASKVEDQIVTDQKGRRRFHGAFTGGFSAGYFNTVGSKEGWTPATFKSSRSKTNETEMTIKHVSKAEDFMDDEDFEDHGIAPKKLKTMISYNSTETKFETEKKSFLKAVDDGDVHSAIPGGVPLDDLLSPPKHSVGVQLLKKMGWKPGQGIGEKVELVSEKEDTFVKKKVYGCALPPKSKVDLMDIQPFAMMLAPKDIQPITFIHKDNLHGIGYSGLVPTQAILRNSAISSDRLFRPSGKEKKGIRGQAFGIGVFEEDDEDIYGESVLSSYDMTMSDDIDNKDGWTGATSKPNIFKGCLPGFIKSPRKLNILITSVMIQIPPDVPRHVFPENQKNTSITNVIDSSKGSNTKLSSEDRSNLLGETTNIEDVKHWTLKWDQSVGSKISNEKNCNETVDNNPIPIGAKKSRFSSRWDKDVNQIRPKHKSDNQTEVLSDTKKACPQYDKSGVFKPFLKYPEKQARYEVYLAAKRKGCKPVFKYDISITEWEMEQEIAEFSRASILYQPLISSISHRFIRANFNDNEDASLSENKKPDDKKAAELGMFGKLTRTSLSWHPDPILCKRMNIPNPFPSSSIKGVPDRNKKHSSFFSDSYTSDIKTITLPGAEKSHDVDKEDDFFSRIQKNKIKTLKNKAGPLSHLNIKVDCQKLNENSNKSKPGSGSMNNNIEKEDIVKPSIDIFKAIFEDSDSDNSDDVNGNIKETEENLSSGFTTINKPDLTSDVSTESKPDTAVKSNSVINNASISKLKSIDTYQRPDKSQISESNNSSGNKNMPKMVLPLGEGCCQNTVTMKTMECKVKNKELPYKNDGVEVKKTGKKNMIGVCLQNKSNLHNNEVEHQIDTSMNRKHEMAKRKKMKKEKKSKKHRKKDSDSDSEINYKKKKKKYKSDDSNDTYKHHKKKKSKKHERSSSSSSGEDSVVPSNAVLLEKLKRYTQSSKRPTAADFM